VATPNAAPMGAYVGAAKRDRKGVKELADSVTGLGVISQDSRKRSIPRPWLLSGP